MRGTLALAVAHNQSASSAGDNADFFLEGELREGALEMHAASALSHGLRGHFAIGGIFYMHAFIRASELALMLTRSSCRGFGGGSEDRILCGINFLAE